MANTYRNGKWLPLLIMVVEFSTILCLVVVDSVVVVLEAAVVVVDPVVVISCDVVVAGVVVVAFA